MPHIRNYNSSDLTGVLKILNHYVSYDACTFQITLYTHIELKQKFDDILLNYPMFVTEENGEIIGFAYGSRWRDKSAYAKSVETTIYVHPDYKKAGIGKALYKKLIAKLTDMGFHLLVAGMTMPNIGSQKLHEKMGFEKVGEFKDAGMKFGRWHSVGFWQKLLN